MIDEQPCRAWDMINANVTVHGYGEGTCILHIESKSEAGNAVSIWTNGEELQQLGRALIKAANEGVAD